MFYSKGEYIKNIVAYLYTKSFSGIKSARLIRLPFYFRNRHNCFIGEGFTCGYSNRITAGDGEEYSLKIGKNFTMGDFCQIEAGGGCEIGDNVLIASRVYIGSNSHGSYAGEIQSLPNIAPNSREIVYKKTIIGNNVWIGNGAAVLAGVVIGDGTIIGANAVVTKDIPKYSIAVGNPARVIKSYDERAKAWVKC